LEPAVAETQLVEECRQNLERLWTSVATGETLDVADLPAELRVRIQRLINSPTKSYRYVLPTQLLAKACQPDLDCRCLQSARGGSGAFDARTIAHKVIVPFDRINENVLGGSPEPYVNNPLRVSEISEAHRSAQKDKAGWDDLCAVVAEVERLDDAQFTRRVLLCVLGEIRARLDSVRIVYPVPRRVSSDACQIELLRFLEHRSGGVRLECVTAALFETVGTSFGLFDRVRSSRVNSADSQSGMVTDIECVDSNDEIVMAVEAKDQTLRLVHIQDKLPALRDKQVADAMFVAPTIEPIDAEAIRALFTREFASGHNLYSIPFEQLLTVLLPILREKGRHQFLLAVGRHLDQHSDIGHRRAWADILKQL